MIHCAQCRTPFQPRTMSRFCSVKCRFLSKVNFSSVKGGCWIWTGTRHGKGYGHFRLKGRIEKAHRVAYQLLVGPIAPGNDVCHKCDTPSCVNPKHLWTGSDNENREDRQQKRNQARGERNHAKLTEKIVIDLRLSREPLKTFARRNHLNISTIRHAAFGRSWRYLNSLVPPKIPVE